MENENNVKEHENHDSKQMQTQHPNTKMILILNIRYSRGAFNIRGKGLTVSARLSPQTPKSNSFTHTWCYPVHSLCFDSAPGGMLIVEPGRVDQATLTLKLSALMWTSMGIVIKGENRK